MGVPDPRPGIFASGWVSGRSYQEGLGDGLGAAQANCCCMLTVMVTVLNAALTPLAPVLKARAKLLVLLSPVMSIGVGIVTP
jgi:hypothetical protein